MKHYTTAQVVALLTRHPDWEFEAPDNDEFHHCKASAGEEGIIFESGNPLRLSEAALRDDWMLTHPKRRKFELGEMKIYPGGCPFGSGEIQVRCDNLPPGKWRVVAVEVRS